VLSKKAKYGLKALLRIAGDGNPRSWRAAELAEAESIPGKFLEQILLELRNEGILQSRRGPGGGHALRLPADEITVARVVRLFDGPLAPVPCASQHFYQSCEECVDEHACGVRLIMKEVRDAVAGILESTTLAALARRAAAEGNGAGGSGLSGGASWN
jgi:Rrf2 family protein